MTLLILGGASSGKSMIAENICLKLGKPLYYLATMENNCDESKRKIENHRNSRKGKGFQTLELSKDIENASFDNRGTLLLECLGTLLSNEMFKESFIPDPCDKILKGIEMLITKNKDTVIVSNDIFSDLQGLDKESLAYTKNLAFLNMSIAKKADIVIEAVFSVPNIIKGEELCRSSGIF